MGTIEFQKYLRTIFTNRLSVPILYRTKTSLLLLRIVVIIFQLKNFLACSYDTFLLFLLRKYASSIV